MRKPSDDSALHEWWRNALVYGVGVPGKTELSEDNPQAGVYRIKIGLKTTPPRDQWLPVRIYWRRDVDESGDLTEDEKLICVVGYKRDVSGLPEESYARQRDPYALWTWVAKKPVTWEAYEAAYLTGTWPDEAPGTGHNEPEGEGFEFLTDRLETLLKSAETFKAVEDQNTCDQVANLKDRLMDLGKQIEAARVAEKRPFDEGAKAVQAKYSPLLDRARDGVNALRRLIEPFLRAAQEAAKQAAVAASGEGAAANLEIRQRAGGMSGRRTGLRKSVVCQIEDYAKVLAFVVAEHAEDRDLVGAVEKIAKRLAKAGVKVPGCKIEETETAV